MVPPVAMMTTLGRELIMSCLSPAIYFTYLLNGDEYVKLRPEGDTKLLSFSRGSS